MHSFRALLMLLLLAAARLLPGQSEQHWSYRPLQRPPLPVVRDPGWCLQPLDRFVLARCEQHGLRPAPTADRATWLRRVALDLNGLPPTPAELAAFVADDAADAFERQVDRLLAEPAFGERWALVWLDLARYADSQGYEKDDLRPHAWRYRDWVIDAFQRDLPFDQFTIEQLAGDLLPAPTLEQLVATAFHRQTMTNTEGGTDDEEFRVDAVIDRTNTTMSVWMGSTVGCAQCHDHKYDPFSQREYYRLFAFFDQTEDRDQPDERPTMAAPTAAQQAQEAALTGRLAALRQQLDGDDRQLADWVAAQRARLDSLTAAAPTPGDWHWLGPVRGESFAAAYDAVLAPERQVLLDQEQEGRFWQLRPELRDGEVHSWQGNSCAFFLRRTIHARGPARATLALGSDDALKVWWNGEPVLAQRVTRAAAPDQELVDVELRTGANELLLKIVNGTGPGGFCFRLAATPFGAAAERALGMRDDAWSTADRTALQQARSRYATELAATRAAIAELEQQLQQLRPPQVPVLRELLPEQRRTTRILLRGSFLTPGEAVMPAVPACWPPLPADAPRNRLGLARWLCAPDNPLTARVQANRFWEELFGRGLVASSEDFGSQGQPPTNPELLDWLAAEFRDDGWSVKRLLRRLVLSATYRQAASCPPGLRAADPANDLLARGPSFRLRGELLRDQALAVSGLLSRRVGGPSVMPPQPDGIWTQIYSGSRWQESQGDDRHRRSLYTIWRRTSPHPAMTVFDAPSREFCVLRRVRTNTPLQALVTWNDPDFVAAAQALGARAVAECGADDRARIDHLFGLCLLRPPAAEELGRLLAFVREQRALLAAEPERARAIAGASAADTAESGALTLCAMALLSLDEFLNKG